MTQSKFEVSKESDGKRLDVFLCEQTEQTRSHLVKLLNDGNITVDGVVPSKSGVKVKAGSLVEIFEPDPIVTVEKEDIPLSVLYQDSEIAVINKPQGLTVHPAAGNREHTLVNALMWNLDSLSGINGAIRPGIVHRLDKDTSGVMVIAKNDRSHVSLAKQIENRTVKKVYVALLEGTLKQESGTVQTNIGRNPKDRKQMAVVPDGKQAITKYRELMRFSGYSLVAFRILTGRTHQIRVHAKYLGHPVVGDKTYGVKKQRFDLPGQLLHALSLTFCHPSSGKEQTFSAPLPVPFEEVLAKLCAENGVRTDEIPILLQSAQNID